MKQSKMIFYFKRFQQISSKLQAIRREFVSKSIACSEKRMCNISPEKTNIFLSLLAWAAMESDYSSDKHKGKDDEWEKEKLVSKYISQAEFALKNGEVGKAEDCLDKAIHVSDKTKTVGITVAYDMLATIAYQKGDPGRAAKLLEEVIAKLSNSDSREDKNMVVSFSLKLARLYEEEKHFDLAEMGFRNCIQIQKQKYLLGSQDEQTTVLWINSLFWFGKFLALRGRYVEAKKCFESAYQLLPHTKTLGNDQAMVTLYNLGEMTFAVGDKEGALKHLLNAVIIGKSQKSQDLPVYYNKIGLIYLHQGILNEAKRWCSNGLEHSKRHTCKSIREESEECLKEVERQFTFRRTGGDQRKNEPEGDKT